MKKTITYLILGVFCYLGLFGCSYLGVNSCDVTIASTEVINHQVVFKVIPKINDTNVATIGDLKYNVTMVIQDPTNNIPYYTEFSREVALTGYRVQSSGFTGQLSIIKKYWTNDFYSGYTILDLEPINANGTEVIFVGGSEIISNKWEIGIIANGLNAFSWTNQLKVTFEGVSIE